MMQEVRPPVGNKALRFADPGEGLFSAVVVCTEECIRIHKPGFGVVIVPDV